MYCLDHKVTLHALPRWINGQLKWGLGPMGKGGERPTAWLGWDSEGCWCPQGPDSWNNTKTANKDGVLMPTFFHFTLFQCFWDHGRILPPLIEHLCLRGQDNLQQTGKICHMYNDTCSICMCDP